MENEFAGRTAVVLGATSGIGAATAVAFGRAGAHVVVAGRRVEAGDEVVAAVRAAGADAVFVACDVRHEDDVAAVMDAAVAAFGRLDVVVNAAGVDVNAGIIDGEVSDLEAMLATNTVGTFVCLKHAMRRMGHPGGAIVTVGSVSGTVPVTMQALYGASKAAVTHLTRQAAREGGPHGIRVNEVLPALLMTDMVRGYFEGPDAAELDDVTARMALGRAGTPEDGADAILFLCSDRARHITGASLPVDGGFLLFNAGA
jgi:NAD(P)-dependent dehydrogenase (short-subunit alcohol dehydrogenase family)